MFFRLMTAGILDLILLIFIAIGPVSAAIAWFPEYMDAPVGHPLTPLMGAGMKASGIVALLAVAA